MELPGDPGSLFQGVRRQGIVVSEEVGRPAFLGGDRPVPEAGQGWIVAGAAGLHLSPAELEVDPGLTQVGPVPKGALEQLLEADLQDIRFSDHPEERL